MPTGCSYTSDVSSLGKKRKLSSPDVPGPSHDSKSPHQQQPTKETPMSAFYHSLLESSYADNLNCEFPFV